MFAITARRCAAGWPLLLLAVLAAGCARRAPESVATEVQTTEPVSTEPGEIELFDPKVSLAMGNRVQFEVGYRFKKGKPSKYYMCEVSFPGTKNHASKPMESWELKPEGVIKDGIVLFQPPVEKFEIRMFEADSPQNGYKKISNVVSGPVK